MNNVEGQDIHLQDLQQPISSGQVVFPEPPVEPMAESVKLYTWVMIEQWNPAKDVSWLMLNVSVIGIFVIVVNLVRLNCWFKVKTHMVSVSHYRPHVAAQEYWSPPLD